MGFLDKKLKKAMKKGKKELYKDMGYKKSKKHKKDKHHYHSASPPPGVSRPPGHSGPPGAVSPPPQAHRPAMGGSEAEMYISHIQSYDSSQRDKGGKKLKKLIESSPNSMTPYMGRFLQLLQNPNTKVRKEVASICRKTAKTAPMLYKDHLETLKKHLNDPDSKVRDYLRKAVETLNSILGMGMGISGDTTYVTNVHHHHQASQQPQPQPQPIHQPAPAAVAPSNEEPPEVHLDIIEEELPYKRWGQIQLLIENRSDVDIHNVVVEIKGPVEVSPIDKVRHISSGDSHVLNIGMKVPEAGRVPAYITATYNDPHNREFSNSRQDWVTVTKPQKQAGTQVNIGSIGNIVSDNSTTIQDSVVQRSNIGGGGGGSGGGGGGGKTVIKGSTMQRSSVAGGGDVTVEDSVMMRSEIGGGGGSPQCPNCGNPLEQGWAICPKCGTQL